MPSLLDDGVSLGAFVLPPSLLDPGPPHVESIDMKRERDGTEKREEGEEGEESEPVFPPFIEVVESDPEEEEESESQGWQGRRRDDVQVDIGIFDKLNEINKLLPGDRAVKKMRESGEWMDSRELAIVMQDAMKRFKELILTSSITSAVLIQNNEMADYLSIKVSRLVQKMRVLLKNSEGKNWTVVDSKDRFGNPLERRSKVKRKDPRIKTMVEYLNETIADKLLWTQQNWPGTGDAESIMKQLLLCKTALEKELRSYAIDTYVDPADDPDAIRAGRIRTDMLGPRVSIEDRMWYGMWANGRSDRAIEYGSKLVNEGVAMRALNKLIDSLAPAEAKARKEKEEAEQLKRLDDEAQARYRRLQMENEARRKRRQGEKVYVSDDSGSTTEASEASEASSIEDGDVADQGGEAGDADVGGKRRGDAPWRPGRLPTPDPPAQPDMPSGVVVEEEDEYDAWADLDEPEPRESEEERSKGSSMRSWRPGRKCYRILGRRASFQRTTVRRRRSFQRAKRSPCLRREARSLFRMGRRRTSIQQARPSPCTRRAIPSPRPPGARPRTLRPEPRCSTARTTPDGRR